MRKFTEEDLIIIGLEVGTRESFSVLQGECIAFIQEKVREYMVKNNGAVPTECLTSRLIYSLYYGHKEALVELGILEEEKS